MKNFSCYFLHVSVLFFKLRLSSLPDFSCLFKLWLTFALLCKSLGQFASAGHSRFLVNYSVQGVVQIFEFISQMQFVSMSRLLVRYVLNDGEISASGNYSAAINQF